MDYVRDVMNAEAPLFNPFAVRKEDRLLLVVPSQKGPAVRTIELSPVQAAKLAVDLHECLTAIARQKLAE